MRDQLIRKKDFHPHCCTQVSPWSAQHSLCDGKWHRDRAGEGREALDRAAQCVGQVGDTWGVPADRGFHGHSQSGGFEPGHC